MAAILYVHGFASEGNSQKVAALRAEFSEREVLAPSFSHRAQETAGRLVLVLNELLAQHGRGVIVVGTSMGGFWANWAAANPWT